jgi:hypothetical protein
LSDIIAPSAQTPLIIIIIIDQESVLANEFHVSRGISHTPYIEVSCNRLLRATW